MMLAPTGDMMAMGRKFRTLIATNTVYGIIALIPVAIVVLVVIELLKILGEVSKPLALHSRLSAALVLFAGLVGLAILCFVVGSLVRTRIGSITFGAIEEKYLKRLPVYEPVANILRGFTKKTEGYRPALVTLYGPGTAVFGLIMEENENDTVTVFVPSAPTMAVGVVHVVQKDRVTALDASFTNFSTCVSQWGIGSRELLSNS